MCNRGATAGVAFSGTAEQKEKLLEPLRASVMDKIYTKHSKIQTRIVAAELGNNAGIIGAAYKIN